MKRLFLLTLLVPLLLAGCGFNDSRNEARGRGDAPVGDIDDSARDIIQFPDRFGNVSHACDGHGHRVFITTGDPNRMMQVIDDASCGDQGPPQ